MDVYKSKNELRRMSRRDLFKLALNQRMSNCLVGGRPCGFLLQYKGNNFCVSEIFREGCQVQRLEQLEQSYDGKGEINFLLPFLQEMETELLSPGKKVMEFKVYYKDSLPRSTIFLGKITESRRRERGDNLQGLLNKAIKQYSDQGVDPSTMFLLEG
jgi:hypothetical protein